MTKGERDTSPAQNIVYPTRILPPYLSVHLACLPQTIHRYPDVDLRTAERLSYNIRNQLNLITERVKQTNQPTTIFIDRPAIESPFIQSLQSVDGEFLDYGLVLNSVKGVLYAYLSYGLGLDATPKTEGEIADFENRHLQSNFEVSIPAEGLCISCEVRPFKLSSAEKPKTVYRRSWEFRPIEKQEGKPYIVKPEDELDIKYFVDPKFLLFDEILWQSTFFDIFPGEIPYVDENEVLLFSYEYVLTGDKNPTKATLIVCDRITGRILREFVYYNMNLVHDSPEEELHLTQVAEYSYSVPKPLYINPLSGELTEAESMTKRVWSIGKQGEFYRTAWEIDSLGEIKNVPTCTKTYLFWKPELKYPRDFIDMEMRVYEGGHHDIEWTEKIRWIYVGLKFHTYESNERGYMEIKYPEIRLPQILCKQDTIDFPPKPKLV
jgi:hypothetical protein